MFADFIWRNGPETFSLRTADVFPVVARIFNKKLYKITALKEAICKQAKSMLNVSGMFFIASGVS